MSQLVKLSPSKKDYFSFLILYLSSYVLADQFVYFLTVTIPGLFAPVTEVLDSLTLPLFITIFVLIFARLITYFLPALNIEHNPNIAIILTPVFILVHPFILNVSGSKLIATWSLLSKIDGGGLGSWIVETLVLFFSAYGIYLIASRQKADYTGPEARYVQYLGKEIYNALVIFLIIYYLLRSFIIERFEGLDLTMPVKLILVYLLSVMLEPMEETE